jgi:3-oxoacyl-[acyl-carrier protein] reductase
MAGSQGLGLACAQTLIDGGNRVALCGRRAQLVDAAVVQLGGSERVLGLAGDVSRPEELKRMLDAASKWLDGVDILVTNCGGPPAGGFFDLDDDAWRNGYDLVLGSFINAIRTVVPPMRSQGWGRVIAIGSSSIRRPIPNLTISNALRPAINGLVKDLAVALASHGITINLVAPGRIETSRVRDLDEQAAQREGISNADVRARSTSTIPAGRYGRPPEFAALVEFLASEAASYLTGQSILVDGAMVATTP